MPSIFPIKFRTELARQFHRSVTNTITSPDVDSLTPVKNTAYSYVATAGEVSFSGIDENGNTLEYTPGKIEVFKNGTKLSNTDYSATTGDEIVLNAPASASDTITVVCFDVFNFPNPSDYFYVFLGRPTAWSGSAPTPLDTRKEEAETKRNIMAVKRVMPTDVALLIARKDWVSGTKYAEYDDDVNLATVDAPADTETFYVYNPNNYRIYKCLNNNNGSVSTTEPAFSEVGPKTLSDGYTWQLMYEVPTADRLRFLNVNYIPVRFYSTSSAFDHNGSVESITLVNGGSGYVSPTVLILGDGVGATATATVAIGEITEITVTNAGEGYSFALVQIIDGSGGGAFAEAVLHSTDLPITVNQNVASYAASTAGAINKIEVTTAGTGYTTSSTVTIEGDGVGATAELTSANIGAGGSILSVTITNRGTGYTFANVLLGAPGAGAVLKAVIEPQGGHGSNIPQELLSTTVGISASIEEIANDFFTGNDFRQIGLIKNLKKFDSNEIFTDNTGNACYIITPTTISNFNLDDVVTTDTGGEYIVVNKTATTVYLLPVVDSIDIDSIMSVDGNNNQTMTDIVEPEIAVNTGELVYVNNVDPITRQAGQVEQLKLYIGF